MTIAIFLGVLLGLMAIGMPIAFALILTGVALMVHLDFFDSQLLSQNLLAGADNFPLMAVPFFLLAGELMNAGGISRRIVALAVTFVGHLRGGLGYVAIGAAVLLSSMSGSAIADVAAMSAILIPMMRAQGYDMSKARGSYRVRRDHRADHSAVDGLHHLRRDNQRFDHPAFHGRDRARSDDGADAGRDLEDRHPQR